jgi:hypothetical protein
MATTTNYGWETPDDTDLVKDGALAMRDLGQDVDTTLGTALNNKTQSGLVLIKTQAIGTGVSSVTVNDAFSANYLNYKIIMTGGTKSDASPTRLRLGASTSNYFYSLIYSTFATGGALAAQSGSGGDGSFLFAGGGDGNGAYSSVELLRPFDSAYTQFSNTTYGLVTTSGYVAGIHKVGTSYTSFTFLPDTGTFTGGTIYVYGYGIS